MEKKTISISYDPQLARAIILAIVVHLFLFTPVKTIEKKEQKPRLVIKTIQHENNIVPFKTVGKKIDTKNNVPLMSPTQHISQNPKTLDLPPIGNTERGSSTLAQKMARILEDQAQKDIKRKMPDQNEKAPSNPVQPIRSQRISRKEIARYSGATGMSATQSPVLSQLIKRSDLMVQMVPPRGVKEDELNKEEQILFSFHKRVVEAYLNGLIRTMLAYRSRYPYMANFPFSSEKVELQAKVTFDVAGNIQQIKMVKWSNQEKVQEFFIDALDSMKAIPNPPKMLTKMDNEFTIYYGLNIDPI